VAVFGGSGFVGSAVVAALRAGGDTVTAIPAPRLQSRATTPAEVVASAGALSVGLATELQGYDSVVNAAGVAHAPSSDRALLSGANALLPAVIQEAARSAGVRRFVHISSAAVQGRIAELDEEPTYAPDSDYSHSKALGETALAATEWAGRVILRPTSVHGPSRPVTIRLAALARSALSVVEAPGSRPTPQVHVESVARAVRLLADPDQSPPPIVLQPSEGFSVASFMTMMGCGRRPRTVPRAVSRPALRAAYAAARLGGSPVWAQARRAEMLLQGQAQVPGWLGHRTDIVVSAQAWQDLAAQCAAVSAGTGRR
jgi:nucleoside-diphosphate-sugar epimerase